MRKEAATTGGDDPEIIGGDRVRAMLVASAHEVWDRGGAGTYAHSIAVTQPWGFSLPDIRGHVEIWHGAADHEILPAMADHAARTMPGARSTSSIVAAISWRSPTGAWSSCRWSGRTRLADTSTRYLSPDAQRGRALVTRNRPSGHRVRAIAAARNPVTRAVYSCA